MNNDPTALAFSLNPYETKQSESLTSYPGGLIKILSNSTEKEIRQSG